jgi:hypothetical protein
MSPPGARENSGAQPREGVSGRRPVRVVRIGQDDGLTLVGEHERELDNRRLGARDDGDLGVRVELDSVVRAVAVGQSFPQLGKATKRRVPVNVRPLGASRQCVDDVRWRPGLGISAPEINERFALRYRRSRNAREKCPEVLLRKPLDPGGPPVHRAIVLPRAP